MLVISISGRVEVEIFIAKKTCILYSTKNTLTCPLHALAYEIKCDECASQAHDLIHPILGRGHSHLLT